MEPRVVVLTRPDELTALRQNYGTFSNAAFFLGTRGSDIASNVTSTRTYVDAIEHVTANIPRHWRRARISRDQLDRFLFEPGDIIAAVGQDGLVANVAKYLKNGQIVIGFNDDLDKNPGVLVKHTAWEVQQLFKIAAEKPESASVHTMVEATLDDGQSIVCLNEIFIGHASHQSAKYTISVTTQGQERQSSSGVLVCTGTGKTGWASSLTMDKPIDLATDSEHLAFFVREPWESPYYSRRIINGLIKSGELTITSMMESNGVIFGDGIEVDHLNFSYGRSATLGVADQKLRLL